MRVFFDENMPRPLRHVLSSHEVSYVEKKNWKGKENGEPLALVEREFDVILTSDAGIQFQKNLRGRNLSMVVLPTNSLTVLRANAVALTMTLDKLQHLDYHVIVVIDWRGRRTMRRLDIDDDERAELTPVTPFGHRGR